MFLSLLPYYSSLFSQMYIQVRNKVYYLFLSIYLPILKAISNNVSHVCEAKAFAEAIAFHKHAVV